MSDSLHENELERFLALVRLHLKVVDESEDIEMDSDLNRMGLDSVSALTLMLDLEEAFGVVFLESMFTEETFATPNALWMTLSTLRKG